MLQPKFTPWPWGLLSVGVPAMAAMTTVAQFLNDPSSATTDERIWRAAAAFFGILGAGNGYLIAIAIGDFGRSVYALPLGALVGFLAVRGLQSPLVAGIAVLIYGVIIFNSMVNGARVLSGCAATGMLGLLLMTIVVNNIGSDSSHPEHLLIGYPIICSMITASMPLDRSLEGVGGAFMVGARSSLHSMVAGMLAFAATMLIASLVQVFVRANMGLVPLLASAVIGAMAANYFCIKGLFDVVYRVEPAAASSGSPPRKPDVPADGDDSKSPPRLKERINPLDHLEVKEKASTDAVRDGDDLPDPWIEKLPEQSP